MNKKNYIFTVMLFVLMHFSASANESVERMNSIISKAKIDPSEFAWLEEKLGNGGIDECIATAILFREDRKKYEQVFRSYFRIRKDQPAMVLAAEEVNKKVNGIIQANKGKVPIEITTQIYLAFKGSNQTHVSKSGSEVYLEMMFRASVFTGVFNPSKEELLKLSALADSNKENLNQSREGNFE